MLPALAMTSPRATTRVVLGGSSNGGGGGGGGSGSGSKNPPVLVAVDLFRPQPFRLVES